SNSPGGRTCSPHAATTIASSETAARSAFDFLIARSPSLCLKTAADYRDETRVQGLAVPAAHVDARVRRFHRRERLEDAVGVRGALRHDPRVARLERDDLPLDVQLRPAVHHVAYCLIVAAGGLASFLTRLLVAPHPHGQRGARGE